MALASALLAALAAAASAASTSKLPHPYSRLGRPPRRVLPLERAPRAPGALRSTPFCTPTDACWPSAAAWASLNSTVGGALLAVAPPLAPCFGFGGAPPDARACDAAVANYSNSYWRASQPGASQEVVWEQDLTTGAACFAPPCALGNIPPMAVRAETVSDVQAALAFAALYNVRVVIKSSGHEYQGRSAGAGALLVWTHALKGLSFDAAFAACPAQPPAPALTAAPGDSFGELYALADANRVVVVGGSEISVSACGGYTLGGGHSWMGPSYGMAVDNALRFEVVLANGTAVAASACENADLFWALRGGGGGTFGVVTSCTYVAHPFPQEGAAGAFVTIELLQGAASFRVLIDGWLSFVEQLGDPTRSGGVVVGGYYIPVLDAPEGTHEHVSFLLGVNGTTAQAQAALAPVQAWVAGQPAHLSIIGAVVQPFASLMAFHESYDSGSEATGYAGTIGSRLLPAASLRNATTRAQLADALTTITYTMGMTGQLVAGGAVRANDPTSRETSITPAWRAAGTHISFGAAWPLNASAATRDAVFASVSALTGLLRDATPGSGAYWSESDYAEPDWEDAFWGTNVPRLQSIKAAVDPNGTFTCHHCLAAA